jgi:hypothetical protein
MHYCCVTSLHNYFHCSIYPVIHNIFQEQELYKKVMLSQYLTNQALCHEDVWGSGCIDPLFLISALDWGEWSASRPGRYTPGERASSTHWIGGWVVPRAGLDDVESTISWPYWDSNSDLSVVQPVAGHYPVSWTLCGMHRSLLSKGWFSIGDENWDTVNVFSGFSIRILFYKKMACIIM